MLDAIVRDAGDPRWVAVVVERLASADPALGARLRDDDHVARAVVALADASRSLTEAVLRDPALLAVVDDLGERDPDERHAEVDALLDDGAADPANVLRHWKRREFVRVALRDLLGLADLAVVAREVSDIADACLAGALRAAAPTQPFALIAMGKLGGRELNYASDVDVLFVHDGDEFSAVRTARRVIALMSDQTVDGIVFRTDADLRPDGKVGALSRTVPAYRAYYAERALAWERQALLKARFCAGDGDLAADWFAATRPALWEAPLADDDVRSIRALKARAEEMLSRAGTYEREVKRGRGGIRDIEIAVQLLQLVHGRHDPAIRSATTLEALAQLARNGYVDREDAEHLDVAYRYLRTVEHRLQLEGEHQVYALPADDAGLDRLARVLGYRDTPATTAREQFGATHRRHQASVRSIHERLFFRPLLDALAGTRPTDGAALAEQLAAFGFRDLAATRAAVEELTMGRGRNATQLRLLLPGLLEALSNAPNPDLGLLQLRVVLDGPVRATAVVPVLRESPVAGERLCRMLGSSKLIGQAVRRQPDFVAELAEDGILEPRDAAELRDEATETLRWRADDDATRQDGLRRFKRRGELRIATRDVLGIADVEDVGRELADLADAALGGELAALAPAMPMAIVGMGKHGGRELGYSSDLDVLFVHAGDRDAAESTAARLLADVGALTAEGRAWEIDARLRPEGSSGLLSRTVDAYRDHHRAHALLWERQALTRARVVAGDPVIAAQFAELRDEIAFGRGLDADETAEIARMRGRVRTERFRRGEVPARHLKLGPGGLADVEFATQLLQLRHGREIPTVRDPGTLPALRALGAAGILAAADVDVLVEAHRFCARARNALHLRGSVNADQLPDREEELVDLGRLLGIEGPADRAVPTAHAERCGPAAAIVDSLFA